MKGINQLPIIELDSCLDLAGFNSLYQEILVGLAKSNWLAGSWGPGVFDKGEVDLYSIELGSYFNRNGAPKCAQYDEIMRATEGMTINQKRSYLKLKYGLYNAGSTVYLRNTIGGDYLKLDSEAGTIWDDNKKYFPGLLDWMSKLPMKETGRVLFFINEHKCEVTEHSDYHHGKGKKDYQAIVPHKHEFIWLRPQQNSKPFYILDESKNERHYIKGQAGWFNSFDIHGADACQTMTWSLRIDGKFTDEFKTKLGVS